MVDRTRERRGSDGHVSQHKTRQAVSPLGRCWGASHRTHRIAAGWAIEGIVGWGLGAEMQGAHARQSAVRLRPAEWVMFRDRGPEIDMLG